KPQIHRTARRLPTQADRLRPTSPRPARLRSDPLLWLAQQYLARTSLPTSGYPAPYPPEAWRDRVLPLQKLPEWAGHRHRPYRRVRECLQRKSLLQAAAEFPDPWRFRPRWAPTVCGSALSTVPAVLYRAAWRDLRLPDPSCSAALRGHAEWWKDNARRR